MRRLSRIAVGRRVAQPTDADVVEVLEPVTKPPQILERPLVRLGRYTSRWITSDLPVIWRNPETLGRFPWVLAVLTVGAAVRRFIGCV